MKFQVFQFVFSLKQWKAARKERQLIARLKQGDREVFRQLACQHFDQLFHYIQLRVKSPKTAKALVSEVFLKLWQSRASVNSQQLFADIAIDLAQEVTFAYLRWVSQDIALQQALFKHFERLGQSKEEPLFEPEYEAVIKAVRNNFLQQELRYQHSTAQG